MSRSYKPVYQWPSGMIYTLLRPQTGFVLLPVVLALALMAVIAFMLNNQSALEVGSGAGETEAKKAEYLASTGVEHATWGLQNSACGGDMSMASVPFGSGGDTYSATVTTGGTSTAYSLSADQDAWFRSDNITNNNGADVRHHLRKELGNLEYVVVRFDLATLPAGAQINSATAWFYVKPTKGHPEGPVTVHSTTEDWTEAGATWDTMASNYDNAVLNTIPPQPAAGDNWVQVNLTAQVQSWVNGQPNYGIMLIPVGEGTHAEYISREGAANQAPRLEVIVGSGPASPANIQTTGTLASGVTRSLSRPVTTAYQPSSAVALQPGPEGKDGWVDALQPTDNYGVTAEMVISGDATPAHFLAQFDLVRVPAGSQILSATLELSLNFMTSADPAAAFTVYRMTEPWTEGTGDYWNPGDGANWDTADGTSGWSWNSNHDSSNPVATTLVNPSFSGWHSWNITSLVQQWTRGTPNNGLLITANANAVNAYFRSSDNSDATLHPKLTITYACECGSACLVPQGSGSIMLIVDDDAIPTAAEQALQATFESWGYSVTLVWDKAGTGVINNAAATHDVVYVAESANSTEVGAKLTNLSIGVVSEQGNLNDELGMATAKANPVGAAINVTDNSHYITWPFPSGSLNIYSAAMEGLTVSGTEAPGLQTLADWGSAGSLVVLDQGVQVVGGGTAAGRRVMLPLGRATSSNFNWDYLNLNGRLMVQRALQWGTGNTGPIVSDHITLSTATEATLGGLSFSYIDIVDYNPEADTASLLFDGALTTLNSDINAVHILANGHILLSTKEGGILSGLNFQDGDLVDYDPGTKTASLYFDESAFSADEDITSVYLMSNGHLLLSTETDASLGGLSFTNKDLVEYDSATGTATLFFDGNATTLSSGIDAVHVLDNGHIMLSTVDDNSLGGLSFNNGSLVDYDPVAKTAALFFSEDLFATGENIVSAHIGAGSGTLDVEKLPIAHWKLDETGVTATATDSVGGHHGKLVNGPAWTPGQLDGGLSFDGSNDFINVPYDSTLSFTQQMSFSAWVKADTIGSVYRAIVSTDVPGNGASNYWFGTQQDELVFGFWAEGGFRTVETTSANLQAGTWYHLAATFDNASDQVRLYVGGVEVSNGKLTWEPTVETADILIGASVDGEYWRGTLDDVRIYDQLLSAADIAELATPPSLLPVAHWKLDETSGLKALDSEGGHDGELVNGPVWTASGKIDGALYFDGNNDYVEVPHSDQLPLKTAFTAMAWVKADSVSSSHRILSKESNGSNDNFWLSFQAGTLWTGIGGSFYSAMSVTTNTWYHIAVTFDDAANQLKVYVDGSLALNQSTTASITANTAPLYIGNNWQSKPWFGLIDDVRLYDQVMDAADIAALAAAGNPEPPVPPVPPGGGGCDGTYRDEFNTRSFANNDGTLKWTDDWQEVGESNGATSGDIIVDTYLSAYQLRIRDNDNGGEGVKREADLTGAASAVFSFEYSRVGLDNSNDYVKVEISSKGLDGPWSELTRYQGPGTDSVYSPFKQDISSYISANTAIRFLSSPNMGNQDQVWFDNIEIKCKP